MLDNRDKSELNETREWLSYATEDELEKLRHIGSNMQGLAVKYHNTIAAIKARAGMAAKMRKRIALQNAENGINIIAAL